MNDSVNKIFNHFKIHTQYSICEGAIKIDQLKDFCKSNKIQSLGISDSHILSGALEFSESLSSIGTQPIVGTQILFKYKEFTGFIPLIAKDNNGYKNIIELSSKSYLENSATTDPHCNFEDLLNKSSGIIVLSGSIRCLLGNLFNKGLFKEIEDIISKLSNTFQDNFYIEIQRHNDLNEKDFENFNLNISKKFDLPLIAPETMKLDDFVRHMRRDKKNIGGKLRFIVPTAIGQSEIRDDVTVEILQQIL